MLSFFPDSTYHLHRCIVHARFVHRACDRHQTRFVKGMTGSLVLSYSGGHEVQIPPGRTAVLTTGVVYNIPEEFFGRVHGSLLHSTVHSVDVFNDVISSWREDEVVVHLINRYQTRTFMVWPEGEIGILVVERSILVMCIPVVKDGSDLDQQCATYLNSSDTNVDAEDKLCALWRITFFLYWKCK